ncbi:hypothetical protein HO173_010520 [Letharia columbiana]|uniref:Uncharacterized protein n=1 Tax=Letharia columbiana TaxID=112416 RepID=A0A8H6FME8_9LECA|nr:uncharacterized protein HO173_010520 [Letharia columbiana]KAF6231188.1 hypothetical protein HO173_010520 [Letharia columbiana]
MTSIVITLSLYATIGIVASASRQLWAFSHDRAVPGREHLQRVNSNPAIPALAVFSTTAPACVLALIVLGSSTAFNDIVSLSVVGLFGSYFLVAVLLLWRRLRGDIKLAPSSGDGLDNVPGKELTWGPWRVPGVLDIMTNSFATVYLIIIFFFSLWPPVNHPTAATMNYSSLMFGVHAPPNFSDVRRGHRRHHATISACRTPQTPVAVSKRLARGSGVRSFQTSRAIPVTNPYPRPRRGPDVATPGPPAGPTSSGDFLIRGMTDGPGHPTSWQTLLEPGGRVDGWMDGWMGVWHGCARVGFADGEGLRRRGEGDEDCAGRGCVGWGGIWIAGLNAREYLVGG